LRIHSVSTVTDTNVHEIRRLTAYLYDRCPAMDHHNLAIIRGDRKNPSLHGPALEEYRKLYDYMKSLWAPRETGRYGAIVEPLLQAAKTRTARAQRQLVPCRAGILSGVVYSNGDVSLCETHPPIGNIRQKSFREVWHSEEAERLRKSIAAKECYCTNEVFLWPSIVYQPPQLIKVMAQARPWEKPKPLPPSAPPAPPAEVKPPALTIIQ
jgi:MoaA/NifB/PqqE/SkfB family radical SAM enzyme